MKILGGMLRLAALAGLLWWGVEAALGAGWTPLRVAAVGAALVIFCGGAAILVVVDATRLDHRREDRRRGAVLGLEDEAHDPRRAA